MTALVRTGLLARKVLTEDMQRGSPLRAPATDAGDKVTSIPMKKTLPILLRPQSSDFGGRPFPHPNPHFQRCSHRNPFSKGL